MTGGGSHLGRSIATTLCELGASVYIASRRRELCEQVAAELSEAGLDCTGLGCDISQEDQVDALIGRAVDDHGRLDILVCNAGGTYPTPELPHGSVDAFKRTVDTNVNGTYMCSQAAARVMVEQRSGTIIIVGSVHASMASDKRFYPEAYRRSPPSYFASKGAVLNLMRILAAELGEYGITVNCLSPGQIPPPGRPAKLVEDMRLKSPLRRSGTPEDIRGAVALLASPAGDWITGQNIIVDGGWSIW